MKHKTFRGRTMADALARVKEEFGRDAVILNTRTGTSSGWLGVRGKPWVEITAARDINDLPPSMRRGTIRVKSKPLTKADGAAVSVSPAAQIESSRAVAPLLSEIGELKSIVGDLVYESRRLRVGDVPAELYETYRRLIRCAIAEDVATQMVLRVRRELPANRLNNTKAVRTHLAQIIRGMVPHSVPIRISATNKPTLIALIGPTGVGKTTTAAKLAANFSLREGHRVGLITIDTYRIAAVEQLRTYAGILDVPLEVATTPNQLKEAVERLADRDVVLIDTAGRSQRDAVKIRELRSFFDLIRPNEIHLVLSTTCGEAVIHEAIERFRDVGIDRVIFTKLDEAIGFGVMLTGLQRANAELSYVTTGQDVPDDIEVGSGDRVAALILGDLSRSAEPVTTPEKRPVRSLVAEQRRKGGRRAMGSGM